MAGVFEMKITIPFIDIKLDPPWGEMTIDTVDCCPNQQAELDWVRVPNPLARRIFSYPKLRCKSCGHEVSVGTHALDQAGLKAMEMLWNQSIKERK